MPELPEVETIARSLRPLIQGRQVEHVELIFRPLLRAASEDDLNGIISRKVTEVRRRGKMLLIEFENGPTLVFHLKMTGQFLWSRPGIARDKHTRMVFKFHGARRELRFRDVRKFGFLLCIPEPGGGSCPEIAALGPEPLEIEYNDFLRRIAKRKGRIKSLLLNQSFVAGVGNIYADELLFEARVHPEIPAHTLSKKHVHNIWEAMKAVLTKAIAAKGTTLRDYTDAEGRVGEFQLAHKVYGREGEECFSCGGLIRRIVVGGRSTFFCPRCQRKSRPKRS